MNDRRWLGSGDRFAVIERQDPGPFGLPHGTGRHEHDVPVAAMRARHRRRYRHVVPGLAADDEERPPAAVVVATVGVQRRLIHTAGQESKRRTVAASPPAPTPTAGPHERPDLPEVDDRSEIRRATRNVLLPRGAKTAVGRLSSSGPACGWTSRRRTRARPVGFPRRRGGTARAPATRHGERRGEGPQRTAGSSIRSVPASASSSTSIPIGTVNWRGWCPIIAPWNAGTPRGRTCSSIASSSVSEP